MKTEKVSPEIRADLVIVFSAAALLLNEYEETVVELQQLGEEVSLQRQINHGSWLLAFERSAKYFFEPLLVKALQKIVEKGKPPPWTE